MTESGFASVVISTAASTPNSVRTDSTIRARSREGSSVGVPPPTNTVAIGRAASPRTRRANRISSTACAAYVACDVEPPSSAAV